MLFVRIIVLQTGGEMTCWRLASFFKRKGIYFTTTGSHKNAMYGEWGALGQHKWSDTDTEIRMNRWCVAAELLPMWASNSQTWVNVNEMSDSGHDVTLLFRHWCVYKFFFFCLLCLAQIWQRWQNLRGLESNTTTILWSGTKECVKLTSSQTRKNNTASTPT